MAEWISRQEGGRSLTVTDSGDRTRITIEDGRHLVTHTISDTQADALVDFLASRRHRRNRSVDTPQ